MAIARPARPRNGLLRQSQGGIRGSGGAKWGFQGKPGIQGEPVDQVGHSDAPVVPSGGKLPLNLLGSHRHALDEKRRVAVPKTFRDQILAAGDVETYVLCRQLGGDPCLALYPAARFEARLAALETMREGAALGVGAKTVRAYLRKVRMSAATLAPDKQGRISLTDEQCRLAGITKDVVFVGAGECAELWAPERLEASEDDGADFTDLASRIFG